MFPKDLRQNIQKIISECITDEENRERIKTLFFELMRDKATWDKFLSVVAPDWSKGLGPIPESDFHEFRKVTMEQIDKWKPNK